MLNLLISRKKKKNVTKPVGSGLSSFTGKNNYELKSIKDRYKLFGTRRNGTE